MLDVLPDVIEVKTGQSRSCKGQLTVNKFSYIQLRRLWSYHPMNLSCECF